MNNIIDFVKNVCAYPPSELFGGIQNPTAKEKKAEQRITNICEELYKIDCPVFNQLREALRDFMILVVFFEDLKPDYFVNKAATLQYHLESVSHSFDKMCNKDPILKEYYSNIKLSKEEIRITIFDYVCTNIKGMSNKEVSDAMKSVLVDLKNKHKE